MIDDSEGDRRWSDCGGATTVWSVASEVIQKEVRED